ncbi:hypothetical protein MPTK1_1g09940 [Marchantia polymorpha subsp. ruderalis]|uniref:Embryo surrounding factor 1 brassicaceae domain-containing protein n=2 Tax=Marchantia polymorpha TaxID=3197 RepID=A0AAF6ANG5_MARPO|nr:hypothetical protein MARPO_0096s0007 [Marchantia polymorpha]BBM97985.1 hypothetical protein Mp_1g09940 [Marchantia polymorpha subsp. ruderalis]|eukprot:PTQ32645.1 hypothetical protein MARPO_0096s0007 [Marchantia polymorpha]
MAWKQACTVLSFVVLFVSTSHSEARSLQQSESQVLFGTTAQGNREKGVHHVDLELNATSSVPRQNAEVHAGSDYHDCYIVCCWQADANCPYPYCNYNDAPCNGQ